MAAIKAIIERVQNLPPESIIVTNYCTMRASLRKIDLEQAKKNILTRKDGAWVFSQHKGKKGQRVSVFFRVSQHKTHEYIIEANDAIYLINVIVIDGKKQKGLRTYES